MAYIYTRTQLKSRVNAKIHSKIGMLVDADETMNDAARDVVRAVRLRTLRRTATLSPDLENEVYEYTCPSDLSLDAIIDFNPVGTDPRADKQFYFVPPEEFDRQHKLGTFTIDDKNGTRVLKVASREAGTDFTVKYYSKFPWQNAGGTYILNSTNDLDLLNADEDEYSLILARAIFLAAQEVNEYEIADVYKRQYEEDLALYKLNNPSEAKILTYEYYAYDNENSNTSAIIFD